MTMTDPIADMLTRLRNASAAKHETVSMPYSKFKAAIAEILKREGYIKDFTATDARVGQNLEITLKYGPNGERAIQGIKRISKPACVAMQSQTHCRCHSVAWVSRSFRPVQDC